MAGKIKNGIALYEIELDSCLNGVYTNEYLDGHICNEIAKMNKAKKGDEVTGDYRCFYFDESKSRFDAKLSISKNESVGTYEFIWTDLDGNIEFKGIGYKMNQRQIAVHYWSV